MNVYYNKYKAECIESAKNGRSPSWKDDRLGEQHNEDILTNSQFIDLKTTKINQSISFDLNMTQNTDMESEICKICMINKINTVCIPCGHRCLCTECKSKKFKECPICRQQLDQIVQTFDSWSHKGNYETKLNSLSLFIIILQIYGLKLNHQFFIK